MEEEPFVFVVESLGKDGIPYERLMSCVERKKSAEGIFEGIMVSASEKEPVICVTAKHLTPHKVYDHFILVIPMKASLIDVDDEDGAEYWEIDDAIFEIVNETDDKGYEKVTITKCDL